MNLREAYRYANFLDALFDKAQSYMTPAFFTTTVETHLRSRMDRNAEDETITVKKPFDVDFTPMDVIDFTVQILSEKEKLMNAIAMAKAGTEINIDTCIAMNKKRQLFAGILNSYAQLKTTTKTKQGTGYRFNVNNEQVHYFYDIEEASSIDFDRNNVRALSRKYMQEADEVSVRLDALEINTEVDFAPRWDVHDYFEDILSQET